MNSYFNHQHPLETNQFLLGWPQSNADIHAIHDIILPHMRYPFDVCTTHQHSLFRNALISLIIDLRLSWSGTARLVRPIIVADRGLHGFGVLNGHLIHSCYFISPNNANTFPNLRTLITEHGIRICLAGVSVFCSIMGNKCVASSTDVCICGFFSSICRSMFASGEIAPYPVTVHSIAIMSQY